MAAPASRRHWLDWQRGLAAPAFLYRSGLSQALADDAQARKGIDPRVLRDRRRGAAA